MTDTTVRDRLAELRIFADWSADQIDALAQTGDLVQLGPGTCLTRAGVPARQAFVIVAGTARSSTGRTFRPGDIVAELEPLLASATKVTVHADTELSVLVLSALGVMRLHQLRAAARQECRTR